MKTVIKCYRLVLSKDEKNKLSEIGTFVMTELSGWLDNDNFIDIGKNGVIWNTGWQLAQEMSFYKCPDGESYYHYVDYTDKEKKNLLDMLKWVVDNPKAPIFSSGILEEVAHLFKEGLGN